VLAHSVSYASKLTSNKANYPYKGNGLTEKNSSVSEKIVCLILTIKLVSFLCRGYKTQKYVV